MAIEQEFAGRVAVITGGGRGFGKAFGHALGMRGAHVVLVDIDPAAAQEAVHELRDEGVDASAVECDIADDDRVPAMIAQIVGMQGGIDIFINNAGLHSAAYNEPMEKSGMKKLRRLFDVNLMGTIGCSLAARTAMRGRENATIVNISSAASYGCNTAYGVSKLAVSGATITLAREFAADGIRVNAIAPGMIATDTIVAELPRSVIDTVMKGQILPRWGQVDDIVEAMLFLCSTRSSFVTGETLRIGGGFALQI